VTTPLDLRPTARAVAGLVDGIADDRLDARTPCAGTSVGTLLDHLMALTLAFTLAARKATDHGRLATESPPGGASADHLDPDWRRLLPRRLDELAEAWLNPAAWQGMTEAGGLEMPGEVTGAVTATELVIHGWDLARATGQPYEVDPAAVEASLVFTSATAEETGGAGQEGLFGPVVEVPASAPPLDRSLGLSGRDPAWTP